MSNNTGYSARELAWFRSPFLSASARSFNSANSSPANIVEIDVESQFDLSDDFSDEEITRPIPHMTLAQVAESWREEIATSERPTRDIRPPSSRNRAA